MNELIKNSANYAFAMGLAFNMASPMGTAFNMASSSGSILNTASSSRIEVSIAPSPKIAFSIASSSDLYLSKFLVTANGLTASTLLTPSSANASADAKALADKPAGGQDKSAEVKAAKTRTVAITAYSSTEDQTDSTPFIAASGKHVYDGMIAANFLPFGTKVKIPALFGEKIFTVEDRMNRRYTERMDIWFSTREQAINFGIRTAEIVIIS